MRLWSVATVLTLAGAALTRAAPVGGAGRGVTVAILDTGFLDWRIRPGDPNDLGRSFRVDRDLSGGGRRHGARCANVLRAVAPSTRLLVANWEPDSPQSFLAALSWAKLEGARVVLCAVAMPAWGDGEGGGPIHEAASRVINGELVAVAAAGNFAGRHWAGRFDDGGNGWHRWPGGSADNALTPWGGEAVSVELSGGPAPDCVLQVVDAGGAEIGHAAAHRRAVRFRPRLGERYAVRVRRPPERFHVFALGAWLQVNEPRGSIAFPGDGPAWLTVGAWEQGRRPGYGSSGPNSGAPKPDLVAAVSEPFGGSSAAAAQVAGAAAALWSRHPDWDAARVKAALRASAADVLAPGHDFESGWGLLSVGQASSDDR